MKILIFQNLLFTNNITFFKLLLFIKNNYNHLSKLRINKFD